jgi:hypothetical protein
VSFFLSLEVLYGALRENLVQLVTKLCFFNWKIFSFCFLDPQSLDRDPDSTSSVQYGMGIWITAGALDTKYQVYLWIFVYRTIL